MKDFVSAVSRGKREWSKGILQKNRRLDFVLLCFGFVFVLIASIARVKNGCAFIPTITRSTRKWTGTVSVACVLYLSVASWAGAAVYSGGDGSLETPYLISTVQDLLDLSNPGSCRVSIRNR